MSDRKASINWRVVFINRWGFGGSLGGGEFVEGSGAAGVAVWASPKMRYWWFGGGGGGGRRFRSSGGRSRRVGEGEDSWREERRARFDVVKDL